MNAQPPGKQQMRIREESIKRQKVRKADTQHVQEMLNDMTLKADTPVVNKEVDPTIQFQPDPMKTAVEEEQKRDAEFCTEGAHPSHYNNYMIGKRIG